MRRIIEGSLALPDRIQYGQLVIAGELIEKVVLERKDFGSPDVLVPDGSLVAPGFVDIQINGGFGKEFKTDTDALDRVARELVRFGTTAFCPTVTTRELNTYHGHSSMLLERHNAMGYARVLGFHFEGPALNPEKAGAQAAKLLKAPADLLEGQYLDSPNLRLVTISPELPGTGVLIERLRQRNIRVGIGHTKVSYDTLKGIYDPNRMLIVHLFNAMDPVTAREPGAAGFALSEPESWFSIIVDGVHLHEATTRLIWNSRTDRRKIICVTDGSAVTGLGPGNYQIGERTIVRLADRAALPNGTLVGSVLTLDVAVRNLILMLGASPHEAIRTVTANPAEFLGLEREIGRLAAGCRADVAILDDDYNVAATYVGGVESYARRES